MEVTTLVFETGGKHNTGATLQIVKERALALGITQVVLASTHGYTAREAQALLAPEGIRVIAVYICHSHESKGWSMSSDTRAELEQLGAFSDKHGGCTPEGIVRDTLYRFSQGMKVAVECLLMAADAGLLDMDQEVIAIGGSSDGADTAIVCWPAYPRTFNSLEIREVLAKPRSV
jgi:hypothetical protein